MPVGKQLESGLKFQKINSLQKSDILYTLPVDPIFLLKN